MKKNKIIIEIKLNKKKVKKNKNFLKMKIINLEK